MQGPYLSCEQFQQCWLSSSIGSNKSYTGIQVNPKLQVIIDPWLQTTKIVTHIMPFHYYPEPPCCTCNALSSADSAVTLPRSLIHYSYAAAWSESLAKSFTLPNKAGIQVISIQPMHTPHTHPILGVFEADVLHHDDRRGDFPTGREIEWQSLLTQNIHLLDTLKHKTTQSFWYNHASLQTSSVTKAPDYLFWLVACKLICWLMSPCFFPLETNVGLHSSNK